MRPVCIAFQVLVLLTGCVREPIAPADARLPALVEPAPASPSPAPAPHRAPDAPDCTRDQDCLLLPWVTCCRECPAVPPFDVGPIEALDAILIESEQRCAQDTRPCDATPACDPVPDTCTAQAACVSGACVVIEDGCGAAVI